ncbi:MAG: glycosyltransferase family 9 protein [Pseudomonadota bacterium]
MVGRKQNPGSAAQRVLVIKLSALGDFVLALGAMRVIRDHHPSARLTLLTTPPYKAFAELCPYVDVVETDGRPEGVKATAALISRIRKEKFDIIYDLHTSGRTGNYFKALNMPLRTPPLWSGHAEGSAFFHDNPNRGSMHSIDRLSEQLEIAGVLEPGTTAAGRSPVPDLTWVTDQLGDRPSHQPEYFGLEEPYMLIIPGASAHREAKRWPAERYGELARRIADCGVIPAIIGGKAEGAIAQEIVRAEPRAKSLVTRTDLFQIVSLARRALFVVGNDTGPMHMATLSGAPGIALFATSESNPDQACPRQPDGSEAIVVKDAVLQQVRVDDVWQIVRALGTLPAPQSA